MIDKWIDQYENLTWKISILPNLNKIFWLKLWFDWLILDQRQKRKIRRHKSYGRRIWPIYLENLSIFLIFFFSDPISCNFFELGGMLTRINSKRVPWSTFRNSTSQVGMSSVRRSLLSASSPMGVSRNKLVRLTNQLFLELCKIPNA